MEIIKLQGTESALYPLVGPLVMNPEVLKQNFNFPFKTTEHYVWYIAMEAQSVIGFVPVEHRGKDYIINNYYIRHKRHEVLKELLSQLLLDHFKELPHRVEQEQLKGGDRALSVSITEQNKPLEKLGYKLTAISFKEDVESFRELGFSTKKIWARYIKLTIE